MAHSSSEDQHSIVAEAKAVLIELGAEKHTIPFAEYTSAMARRNIWTEESESALETLVDTHQAWRTITGGIHLFPAKRL